MFTKSTNIILQNITKLLINILGTIVLCNNDLIIK